MKKRNRKNRVKKLITFIIKVLVFVGMIALFSLLIERYLFTFNY